MSVVVEYRNKLILAPMVRIGEMPIRVLALRYGADLVYSPELIAKKLGAPSTKRIVNNKLKTIDFIDERHNGGNLVLRIHSEERGKLVCQIGASDPASAVAAAKKVMHDVVAIDLNCGCPKKFSVHDGSGSALLETPDLLVSILEALIEAVDIPVTCKIRLLPPKDGLSSQERTISLLKRVEATGIAAVGIHCRFPHEKPREPGHWDVFTELVEAVKIPVIANGDVWTLDEVKKLRKLHPSISSFMIARGAERNVSCFRKEGPLPIQEVMIEYMKLAIEFQQPYSNVKYCLMQMERETQGQDAIYHKLRDLKTIEDVSILFALHHIYLRHQVGAA